MFRTIIAACVIAVCAGVIIWLSQPRIPVDRITTPLAKRVDVFSCAECHPDQVKSLESAPHGNTLRRATEPSVVRRFAGKSLRLPNGQGVVRFEQRDGDLWAFHRSTGQVEPGESVRLDWAFGSGHHAQTLVSTWPNLQRKTEGLEHRVSWYPDVGLSITLGQTGPLQPGLTPHGKLLNDAKTMNCFACHSSYLPHDSGDIDFHHITRNVGCVRCHDRANEHVAAATEGKPDQDLKIKRWSGFSPLESVNRCGECHRRADEFTAEELTPANKLLIRFAPAGLVMSRCFQRQDAEGAAAVRKTDSVANNRPSLTCLTCHDPHQAAESNPNYYRLKCIACHAAGHQHTKVCSSQPTSSQCVTCHMPKVELHPNLSFTDHWIRVRTK